MLEKGDVVVNIVDATNLERNLFLTLELRAKKIPMVIALNMWDETRHKGVQIDVERLEKELGVPVVPTCGITGFGIKELVERIRSAERTDFEPMTKDQKWEEYSRSPRHCATTIILSWNVLRISAPVPPRVCR